MTNDKTKTTKEKWQSRDRSRCEYVIKILETSLLVVINKERQGKGESHV